MITAEMTIWKNFMTMPTTAMGIWAYCSWPNTGPRAMLTKAQQPSPTITAMARATTVRGNSTVLAALP